MNRGDIYWADDAPGGRRPVVIVARDSVLRHLNEITVAPVTSTLRDIPSHVRVGEDHGLDHESNINCDALATVLAATLTEPIGHLDANAQRRVDTALRYALGLESPAGRP